MFSGSVVYSPGDNFSGQIRQPTRDFVGSTWTPQPLLGTTGSVVGLTAAVALALIWFVGRRK